MSDTGEVTNGGWIDNQGVCPIGVAEDLIEAVLDSGRQFTRTLAQFSDPYDWDWHLHAGDKILHYRFVHQKVASLAEDIERDLLQTQVEPTEYRWVPGARPLATDWFLPLDSSMALPNPNVRLELRLKEPCVPNPTAKARHVAWGHVKAWRFASPTHTVRTGLPNAGWKALTWGVRDRPDNTSMWEPSAEEIHPAEDPHVTETFGELDPNGLDQHAPGAKLDAGKNLLGLVLGGFSRALQMVGLVGTGGAEKYTPMGWAKVDNGVERYTDAMMRHYFKEATGESLDADTELLHAAHLAWNALARLDLMIREKESK